MSKDENSLLHYFRNLLMYPGMLFALYISSIIVHEIGHILVALIKGIKPNELVIGWWAGIGPGVTVPSFFPLEDIPFYNYAGGITAAFVFFSIYVVFMVHSSKMGRVQWTDPKWWVGEFLLLFTIFQLFNGYIEGAYFQEYVTNPAILLSALIIAVIISLVIHSSLTFKIRDMQRQDN